MSTLDTRPRSQWFNASKAAPVRTGWYEVRLIGGAAKTSPYFRRYWDGHVWSWPVSLGTSRSSTARNKSIQTSHTLGQLMWRGLLK